MALDLMRQELTCSISLNIYRDPVTLPCGHSFCKTCITKTFEKQIDKEYFCPECFCKFKVKPRLEKNTRLRNLAEQFSSAKTMTEMNGIPCSYCVQSLVPAVKTCLHCEASLCDIHLRVHSKSEEHVLTEPTTSLENRKCSVHKKVLEYYCCEDAAWICVSCRLDGEHRGHQVESLNEASEKKKETLRNILEKLISQREEAEKRVQSLEEHRGQVQERTAGVTELANSLIRHINQQLVDLQEIVLCEITMQEEQVLPQLSHQIQELEIQKEELSRKMGDIEELCDMMDPFTVLQGRESDRTYYCDTMEVENEDVIHVRDTGDLDVGQISETLYTGLAGIASQIMSQLDVTDDPGMFLALNRSSQLFPDITMDVNTSSDMLLGVDLGLGMVQDVNYALDLLLDANTAGNRVSVSPDLKTASWSGINQSHPETPERFQYPQVLSSRSFSSGRHYWEVETGRSGDWMVGMAYPSIERKGNLSYIGSNDKSWALWRWDDNQYYIKHNSRIIPLSHAPSSHRIGIYLDYEAGHLLFYEICEANRQFHNIKTTFTEPLHVAVWLGSSSWLKVG